MNRKFILEDLGKLEKSQHEAESKHIRIKVRSRGNFLHFSGGKDFLKSAVLCKGKR